MLTRRHLLGAAMLAAACRKKEEKLATSPALSARERVDRALAGRDVDRPPFSFWYHFGLEKEPGERHAEATLNFHRKFHTDIVKVMSDYPYPKGTRKNWWELEVTEDPFPEQVKALRLIAKGLGGSAHFIETLFNPWNVAEKLSSPAAVKQLMAEKPQQLLDALEVIARSQAQHARKAISAGASGIFLAIANAQEGILSRAEYEKFSEPFDRMVLDAVSAAPLNTLHLHGDKVYLEHFLSPWPAAVIHYSVHGTGVPFAKVRASYTGVLMGGIDEQNYRTLTPAQLVHQAQQAMSEAGRKFFLAPGCSVPNETTDEELLKMAEALGITRA